MLMSAKIIPDNPKKEFIFDVCRENGMKNVEKATLGQIYSFLNSLVIISPSESSTPFLSTTVKDTVFIALIVYPSASEQLAHSHSGNSLPIL